MHGRIRPSDTHNMQSGTDGGIGSYIGAVFRRVLGLGGALIDGIRPGRAHRNSNLDITMDASLTESFELDDSAFFD